MPGGEKLRGKKRRKRRYHGNQFDKKRVCTNESTVPDLAVYKHDKEELITESGDAKDVTTPTCSEKKLFNVYNLPCDSSSSSSSESESSDSGEEDEEDGDVEIDDRLEGYRLIDVNILNRNIAAQLSCKFCGQDVSLHEIGRAGLASEFSFQCENKRCNSQQPFLSCPPIEAGNLQISSVNRRACFAMRCLGGGLAELETFCGVMNMPHPVRKTSNNKIQRTVMEAATKVQRSSMKAAAEIEHAMAECTEDPIRDIDVSLDGTYLTRGHTSLIGVSVAIGCVTGKVLDNDVLSKSCKSCDYWGRQDPSSQKYQEWKASHGPKCTKTHEGSSGSMESKIACDVFARSVDLYNLRYTRFIGDGDVNSFKKVCEAKPYGDTPITKIECVGHVQKRMGTRLRNLKNTMKGRKLEDGKTLGGKGRLTDEEIGKIQQYYGNAIRENKGDLVKMREAVWAVYFHKRSSDKNPMHHFCRDWCPFLQAEKANKLHEYHHKGLPECVMDAVKPIFKDLSNTELLRRCLDGYTQNANESLNHLIWKYCPKTRLHGIDVVRTALAIATSTFNDGADSLRKILEAMGISAGTFTREFLANKDALRVKTARHQAKKASKEFRRAQRLKRLGREEEMAAVEGNPYVPGGY